MTGFKGISLSSSCFVSHLTPLAPSTVERCAGCVVGGQVWLPSLVNNTRPCEPFRAAGGSKVSAREQDEPVLTAHRPAPALCPWIRAPCSTALVISDHAS